MREKETTQGWRGHSGEERETNESKSLLAHADLKLGDV